MERYARVTGFSFMTTGFIFYAPWGEGEVKAGEGEEDGELGVGYVLRLEGSRIEQDMFCVLLFSCCECRTFQILNVPDQSTSELLCSTPTTASAQILGNWSAQSVIDERAKTYTPGQPPRQVPLPPGRAAPGASVRA